MSTITFKTRGFAELERALVEDLPKATAKNVLRRTALTSMEPLEERAQQLAPRDKGGLVQRITTKVVKARRTSRTRFETASGVTVATGPTGNQEGGGKAGWQEFGTVNMPANPYMRPAADSEIDTVLQNVRDEMTLQVGKAKARIARKLAKG